MKILLFLLIILLKKPTLINVKLGVSIDLETVEEESLQGCTTAKFLSQFLLLFLVNIELFFFVWKVYVTCKMSQMLYLKLYIWFILVHNAISCLLLIRCMIQQDTFHSDEEHSWNCSILERQERHWVSPVTFWSIVSSGFHETEIFCAKFGQILFFPELFSQASG